MDPTFRNAIEAKGWVYFAKGEFDTAISLFTISETGRVTIKD
jgi:hypothetical protein